MLKPVVSSQSILSVCQPLAVTRETCTWRHLV